MTIDLDYPVLITGGAGFIGCNLAARLLERGRRVMIYDSLARPGAQRNLAWLETSHAGFEFKQADIRDPCRLREAVARAGMVFHFAAQVAVTTSIVDPRQDFLVNLEGTVNLLEAIREVGRDIGLLFTSTNKVYGALDDLALDEEQTRYVPSAPGWVHGVDESRGLDFHSPYGCSKGAADQYVLDYARTYGLRAAVFRMSCIYGPHQFGNEDQGWLAHFVIQALQGAPITIYGDGKQVRDVLFIDDLVDAFERAEERIGDIAGQAFNIGGGPDNAVSLMELLGYLAEIGETAPRIRHGSWRQVDQRWYVSDPRKFGRATGWYPRAGIEQGVPLLRQWLADNVVFREPLRQAVAG